MKMYILGIVGVLLLPIGLPALYWLHHSLIGRRHGRHGGESKGLEAVEGKVGAKMTGRLDG